MSKRLTSTHTHVTVSRTDFAERDIRAVVDQLNIGLQRLPEQVLLRLASARHIALMVKKNPVELPATDR